MELFANLFGAYNKRWEKGEFEQTVFADTLWVITNNQKNKVHNPFLEGRFGFNYQLDDNNSFGGFYQNTYDYVKTWSDYDDDLLADGSMYDHLQNSSVNRAEGAPKHQVNLYYTGKIGKLAIDFNADYTYRNQRNRNQQQELRNIQSDNIKNVEVIQNPGARYDATVNDVIIIHTKRTAGEGLGVELTSWSRKGHGFANNERINLTNRTGKLE